MSGEHQHTPQCQALLEQICDYIDGELAATACAELEQHLAGCHDCRVLVDTTRKTILLYRRHSQPQELPEGVMARLHQAMRQAGCSGPGDE